MTINHDPAPEPSLLQDWQRMHAALLDKERLLADIATRHAFGEVSEEELAQARQDVGALRALADAIFARAFGVAPRQPK
jgi:hypothetical protein